MNRGTLGERRLWIGTRPRLCSTSMRRPRTAVSEWMRQSVQEVYHRWLALPAEWTPAQRDQFITLETESLDKKAFALAMDLRESEIRRWTGKPPGQPPDHATTVRIHQSAEENAREAVVREHLYSKIPQDSPQPPEPVTGVPWDKRWMDHRFRPEPSEAIKELARTVWPDHSSMFRAVAGYLLATRHQEGLDLPTSPNHVLAQTLVAPINQKLGRIGYAGE